MKNDLFVVKIPQLGVNDMTLTIVKWYVQDGEYIEAGKPMCTLETGKVILDIESEASGYLYYLLNINEEININEPIALIGPDHAVLKEEKRKYLESASKNNKGSANSKDNKATAGHSFKTINISWDKSRTPVVIYGAGRGAVSIKECLDLQQTYQVVCFLDDNPNHFSLLCELPVYHASELEEILKKGVSVLGLAIADGNVRLRIRDLCHSLGIQLMNIIHPKAYISSTVKMGQGNYVQSGAIIETNCEVGDCCIIGNGTIVAHDNVIGNGCHLAPGVAMGSSIKIGDLTIVGIGASVSTKVLIGKGTIISVGSSVTKDVPDYVVIEGVPGKIVGTRKKE